MAIEILSEKAVAVGAKPDHHIEMINKAFGRDLEHTRASNGTVGGWLHEVCH